MTPEEVRGILGSALPPVQPEVELLLACARTRILPDRAEQIARLAASDLDWPLVVRLSRLHGIAPLLYRSLHQTCADQAPVEVLRGLAYHYHRNSLHNQWLTQRLLELLDLLAAGGIAAIALKGPVLGAAAYGDPALRESCDLDLLVHETDLPAVEALLRDQGYGSGWPWPVDSPGGRFHRRHEKEIVFSGTAKQPQIDLHWRLSPLAELAPPPLEDVWQHAQSVTLSGRNVPCLGAQELVTYLVMPAGRHAWQQLSLVCDLAEAVAAWREPSWETVAEQCRESGCSRLLRVGLLVLQATLGAELPPDLAEEARADRRAAALARPLAAGLLNPGHFPVDQQGPLFHLKARERLRDRARSAASFVLLPGPHEWATIRLPGRLFWLYSLLRPLRLTARYAGFAVRYLLPR